MKSKNQKSVAIKVDLRGALYIDGDIPFREFMRALKTLGLDLVIVPKTRGDRASKRDQ